MIELHEWISYFFHVLTNIEWFKLIEAVGTLLIGGAASFAAWAAWKGWKQEIRDQTEYKLAVGLLAELYRLRDEIDAARNPVILNYEMVDDEGNLHGPQDVMPRFKATVNVYKKRWKRVGDAQQEIYTKLQPAEAIWGEDIYKLFRKYFLHVGKINFAISEYLESQDPHSFGQAKVDKQEAARKSSHIFRSGLEKNPYEDEQKKLIKEIEDFLKPKLKL